MLEESMSGPITNPVFLAFEASGDQASVAVLAADGRQAMFHHAARHGHAAAITSLAEAALQACGMDAGAVTHVAAGCGPGSGKEPGNGPGLRCATLDRELPEWTSSNGCCECR